jgi:tetratricopeptide (TPR) repeat protein
MKGKYFLLLLLVLISLMPTGKGWMFSLPQSYDSSIRELPIPPLGGRTREQSVTRYLSRTGVPFSTWFAKGKNYLARKEFEQAILAFRKAIECKPLSAETHFLLGVAYEARGKEGLPGDQVSWDLLAEREYRYCISLDDYLPARYNLGMLLSRIGRKEDARGELEHILLVSPKSQVGKLAKRALDLEFENGLLPETLGFHQPNQGD